ncbi:aminoacyl-tRNA hydrolase [bacterium DOLZORAL124_64_63]|nr:MAG: aminoacyl-tRNA hydrolase [bacterium DOLZORAL124_64_63]
MPDDLIINGQVSLPDTELEITTSRSSGPGGQHVNKTDTRVTVRWNLETSAQLSPSQRDRARRNLASRLTADGDLLVHCDTHRSQRRNRDDARQRLAALLRSALVPPKVRRKTRPSAASRRKRLENKRRRGDLKKSRGRRFNGSERE